LKTFPAVIKREIQSLLDIRHEKRYAMSRESWDATSLIAESSGSYRCSSRRTGPTRTSKT
jgi:hypothetical protein